MRLQLHNLPVSTEHNYVSNEREYYKLMQQDKQLSARNHQNAKELRKLNEPAAVTRSHQVLNPAPALQIQSNHFILPQSSFCSPQRSTKFKVKRHSLGNDQAQQLFFRSSTPLASYFSGQLPQDSQHSRKVSGHVSPYGGMPQQVRHIAKMARRQKWHANEKPQQALRTSEEYAMLSEMIGIRKSMQNIDYKSLCFNCNSDKTRLNLKCSECNGNGQYVQQLSHRSHNSCSMNNLSPRVQRHFSPRVPLKRDFGESAISTCSDVVRIAQQRADEARRSHRRFDVRALYHEQQSSQKQNENKRQSSGSPSYGYTTPKLHGHGSHSVPLLSLSKPSASQYLRLQPSQNSSVKRSNRSPTIQKGRQMSVQQPQNFVIIDNNRHQSCAIQQPCNFCDNHDCFAPANGIETCCMQLLQQENEIQRQLRLQQDEDLQRLDARTPAMNIDELRACELGGIIEHTEEDPPSTIEHQTSRDQLDEIDDTVDVEPLETVIIYKNGTLMMAPPLRETTTSSNELKFSGKYDLPKEILIQDEQDQEEKEKRLVTAVGQTQTVFESEKKQVEEKPIMAVQSTQTQGIAKMKKKKKKKKPVAVAEVQTAVDEKPKLVSQSAQASPIKQPPSGNAELQRFLAMLNRLCVYYLSKQSRSYLEQRRIFFEDTQLVVEQVRSDLQKMSEEDKDNYEQDYSQKHESAILQRVRNKCETLLRQHAPLSLIQNFELPKNLEGNLELIVYLLDNSLKLIFEKMVLELKSAQDIAFCDISANDSQSRILQLDESFEARPESPIPMIEFSLSEEIAMDTSTDEIFKDHQHLKNRNHIRRRADMSSFDREKFYKRLGINVDAQADAKVEYDVEITKVEEALIEESEVEVVEKVKEENIERPKRDCSVEQTVQLAIIVPKQNKPEPEQINHQTQETQTMVPISKDAANQSINEEKPKATMQSMEIQTEKEPQKVIIERGIQVKTDVKPIQKAKAQMATQETQTIKEQSPKIVKKVEPEHVKEPSPPKKVEEDLSKTDSKPKKIENKPEKIQKAEKDTHKNSMELEELIEVQSEEFGSMGLADNEEISIEKSIDVSHSKRRRADLASFDLEAFYRRQGVYEQEQKEVVIAPTVLLERQMTTEEYELDLADPSPIEMNRKVDLAIKQRPPDMVDRDAFYKRIGIDLSDKKSDAPTEKKAQHYSLPVVEPMMFTWTYQAMRFEEQKSIQSYEEEADYDDLCEVESSEAENIDDSDQEQGIAARLNIQKSGIENKLKLNDYVFDEGQNLQEELLKIELRQMVGSDAAKINNLNQVEQQQVHEWDNPGETISPRHHQVRYPIKMNDEDNIPTSRQAQYYNENQANAIQHAVKFVSPVSLGGARPSVTELKFLQRYGSPHYEQNTSIAPPANEDTQPNLPYKTGKLRNPQQEFIQISPNKAYQKHYTRNNQLIIIPVSGKQTPQGHSYDSKGGFDFNIGTPQESAPTTKIDCNGGNLSERLQYNRDPLNYNRNSIEIDDDGNLNIASSPSQSPSPVRCIVADEEKVEEAKTFQSSHFLFSHLMSFDAKKHTLSQLNKSSRANLVQKGLQSQARDFAGASTFGASRYGSPSTYSRQGMGSAQVGPVAASRRMGSLAYILQGANRGAGRPRSPFISGVEANSVNNGSFLGSQSQLNQPPVLVKQASKIQFVEPTEDLGGSQDVLKEISSSLKRRERSSSPSVKQHTFYPGQFQQVIPEQLHEDTHRKMTTTAKFMQEEMRHDSKQNSNSAALQQFLFSEQTEGNHKDSQKLLNGVDSSPSKMESQQEMELNRRSSMSQGNFSKYFVGNSGNTGQNVFAKYLARDSAESGTDRMASNRDIDQMIQPMGTQSAENATTFRSGQQNVNFASRDMVVGSYSLVPDENSQRIQRIINNDQTSTSNPNASMEQQQIQHAPIKISQLLADQPRPVTSGISRGRGVASRQTMDLMRSEFGGRSSAQDTASVMMKKRTLEMKGPQPSDIMPVFKMQKAQPVTNPGLLKIQRTMINSSGKKQGFSRNDDNFDDQWHFTMNRARYGNDIQQDGRRTVQADRHQQIQMQRPSSSQVTGAHRGRHNHQNSLIKIVDF